MDTSTTELLGIQFIIGRYGYLPYIVTTQLDLSEPTAITCGILGVLLGLSGLINVIIGVGLLKNQDH